MIVELSNSRSSTPDRSQCWRSVGREQSLLGLVSGEFRYLSKQHRVFRQSEGLRPLPNFQTTLSDAAMPSVIWITAAPVACLDTDGWSRGGRGGSAVVPELPAHAPRQTESNSDADPAMVWKWLFPPGNAAPQQVHGRGPEQPWIDAAEGTGKDVPGGYSPVFPRPLRF